MCEEMLVFFSLIFRDYTSKFNRVQAFREMIFLTAKPPGISLIFSLEAPGAALTLLLFAPPGLFLWEHIYHTERAARSVSTTWKSK